MVYVPFLAGQKLTADLLNTRLVEVTMDWTDLALLGTFTTNYSATASNPPQMRKIMFMGLERWEYKGRISIVSGSLIANTDTVIFTFNTGYRPTVEHGWSPSSASSDFFAVRMTLQTNGELRAGVPSEAGNNSNAVILDDLHIDSPI